MQKLMVICVSLFVLKTSAQQNFTDTQQASVKRSSTIDSVFRLADKMAEFPGGSRGWTKYIQKNVDYSVPLKNNAPQGRYNVIVMFVIDKKGNLSDFKTLTNHGFGMEEEALRVIEKGPRWIPAVQKGKNVNSYRKQPLSFNVSGN